MKHYTANDLRDLPTITVGQVDSLKIEETDQDGPYRVWLCRSGVEDGMPVDDLVTIERVVDGRWITVAEYAG